MADIDLNEVRKRHEAASDEVVRLCSPGGRWRMSIPADERRDSDIVLDVALADIPALLRIIEGYDRTPAEERAKKAEAERDEYKRQAEVHDKAATRHMFRADKAEQERDALKAAAREQAMQWMATQAQAEENWQRAESLRLAAKKARLLVEEGWAAHGGGQFAQAINVLREALNGEGN